MKTSSNALKKIINDRSCCSRQQGAVLLVSLIILLIMTLLGVSAMNSTRLEMKMATNDQSRQQAFQAAEAALVAAETDLQTNGVTKSQLQDCAAGTSSCYESTCAGGLCFNGTYDAGADQYLCVLDTSNPPPVKPWRDATLNVFSTSGKHKTVDVEGIDSPVNYIVEFLCYVDADASDGVDFGSDHPNAGAPLFRITAVATSNDGKSQVALQSTYRYNE